MTITIIKRHRMLRPILGVLVALCVVGSARAGQDAAQVSTYLQDASLTFAFSPGASAALESSGLLIQALGNSLREGSGWKFAMPVTSISVDMRGKSGRGEIVSLVALGSALKVSNTTGAVFLSNFVVDLSGGVVSADLSGPASSHQAVPIFVFDAKDRAVVDFGAAVQLPFTSFTGMQLDPAALPVWQSAMALSAVQVSALSSSVLGGFDAGMLSTLRSAAISNAAFTGVPSAIPEPRSLNLMLAGMAGLFILCMRKMNPHRRALKDMSSILPPA